MATISTIAATDVTVTHLLAECEVRYWEDADVDGVEDADGTMIPCRSGDIWAPKINLDTGVVENWTAGVCADIHYKVCDAGRYSLLGQNGAAVVVLSGYVPSIMSPGDNGFGDYVIMKIDGAGQIQDWKCDLSAFEAYSIR